MTEGAWQPYNIATLFPGAVESVANTFDSVSGAVGSALQSLASALEALSALLLDLADPLKALIDTLISAINELQELIFNALNSGVYLYIDGGPALSGGKADGMAGFFGRLEASFHDPGDKFRPQFTDSAQISALVLVGGANDLPSLAPLLGLFGQLFGIGAFLDAWEKLLNASGSDTFPELIERGMSTPEDWQNVRLGDYLPPLDDVQRLLSQIVGLLKTAAAFPEFLRDLAQALQDKADLLLAIAAEIRALLNQLLALLAGAGLYALSVRDARGLGEFVTAVRSGEDAPPFTGNAYVSGVVLLGGTADFSPVLSLFGV